MNLEQLLHLVPAWAKDLQLNMENVLRQPQLTPQQLWGTALASTITVRNARLLEAVETEAAKALSPTAMDAARTAAAIMGMNNVYFRFLHLTENPKYRTIPAGLRMNAIRSHGVAPADFELWCVAVSAINNCQACVESHEKGGRDKGLTEEVILAAIRIASVIHALAPVLECSA